MSLVVTAALAWFDERLEDLERCVRSLEGLADRLVAVDGRYVRYEWPVDVSPPEQAELIERVGREVGLEVELHVPEKPWRGQVAKRSFLLHQAAVGADWVLGVDADHEVVCSPGLVRAELSELSPSVLSIDVDFWTPTNDGRPLEVSAAGEWHVQHAGRMSHVSAFWRAVPGLRVEKMHWWYSGMVDGRRVWLWGGDQTYPRMPARRLVSKVQVTHWCLFRDERHVVANRDFCEDREQVKALTGQEDDVPLDELSAAKRVRAREQDARARERYKRLAGHRARRGLR